MAGTATYRVVNTDFELTHAYITDRVHLEQQGDQSVWGPVRGKMSKTQLQSMTALGEVLNNAEIDYLDHLWAPGVLSSTEENKEICPFIFCNFLLAATRSRTNFTSDKSQQVAIDREDPRAPAKMFEHYDAASFVAADQTVVSDVLMSHGLVGRIVGDGADNNLPKPVPIQDALSKKLGNGTFEQWQ